MIEKKIAKKRFDTREGVGRREGSVPKRSVAGMETGISSRNMVTACYQILINPNQTRGVIAG